MFCTFEKMEPSKWFLSAHPRAVCTQLWPRPKRSAGLVPASQVKRNSVVVDPGTGQGKSHFPQTAVILAIEAGLHRFGDVTLLFQSRYKIRTLEKCVT